MGKLGQESKQVVREFIKQVEGRIAELDQPQQSSLQAGVLPRDVLQQLTRTHVTSLANALAHEAAKLALSFQDVPPPEEVHGITQGFLPLLDKLRSSTLLVRYSALSSVRTEYDRLVVSLLRSLVSVLEAALKEEGVSTHTGLFLSFCAALEHAHIRNRPAALASISDWRRTLKDALDELRGLIQKEGDSSTNPPLEFDDEEDDFDDPSLREEDRETASLAVRVLELGGQIVVFAERTLRERMKREGEDALELHEEIEELEELISAAKNMSEAADEVNSVLMMGGDPPPSVSMQRVAKCGQIFVRVLTRSGSQSWLPSETKRAEVLSLSKRLDVEAFGCDLPR
eukprot:TRINITY_DN13380_c0_g1_i1.p1 TRINITY_DN13380_c0_g1~~TRINITY_DN13380_c0_g1_i1.p1  ORF type:complete len:343 (+),score=67.99 TRINITY_DN13380_c0_g1_i1:131-1159(+)